MSTTTNSIDISWTAPSDTTVWDSYRIEVDPVDGSGSPITITDPDNDVTSHTITGLTAGKLYSITVFVVSGAERSAGSDISINAGEF